MFEKDILLLKNWKSGHKYDLKRLSKRWFKWHIKTFLDFARKQLYESIKSSSNFIKKWRRIWKILHLSFNVWELKTCNILTNYIWFILY